MTTASSSRRAIDVGNFQAAPVSYDGELAVTRKPSACVDIRTKRIKTMSLGITDDDGRKNGANGLVMECLR